MQSSEKTLLNISVMQPLVRILSHKLNGDGHKRNKEQDANNTEKLTADHSGDQGIKRRQPNGIANHSWINKLVFNKLNDEINGQTPDNQRRVKQRG